MCDEDAERLRAERKAKRRAHYLANREKVLARNKAYRAANREEHWLTQRRTGRRTRNSGRPPIKPTTRRTGNDG